ncbi:hypothetical protein [Streptomyces sp. NPDC008121]|uniref:hypothetical protein n=1 Tax=Streptomyces sp. NPDC008121 TaxID=3364809 RepID=UPI0036E77E15
MMITASIACPVLAGAALAAFTSIAGPSVHAHAQPNISEPKERAAYVQNDTNIGLSLGKAEGGHGSFIQHPDSVVAPGERGEWKFWEWQYAHPATVEYKIDGTGITLATKTGYPGGNPIGNKSAGKCEVLDENRQPSSAFTCSVGGGKFGGAYTYTLKKNA